LNPWRRKINFFKKSWKIATEKGTHNSQNWSWSEAEKRMAKRIKRKRRESEETSFDKPYEIRELKEFHRV